MELIKAFKNIDSSNYKEILSHIPQYVKSTPNKEFRKHLSTYLTGEHWNDEIIKNNINNKKSIYEEF